ncbi:MAG TPA: hypothetical protein VMD75_11420 [Candidatus Binataceae bacterium]|nr:hypothetical protein [Candidatus Binataceae bacterium]
MATSTKRRPVLLIGSVSLGSAAEVFEAAGTALGDLVRRIPDGETGIRLGWIGCQAEAFQNATGLQAAGERVVPGALPFTLYGLKPGTATADVKFDALGYATTAIESYQDFKRLRAAGKVHNATRFQVSLPTPFAVAYSFSERSAFPALWQVYERRLLEEVDEIARAIPHRDLAIQWDVCLEILEYDTISDRPEATRQLFGSGLPREDLLAGVVRISDHVPADIELGLHFCYGDPGHKHVIEPKDSGPAVEMTNLLSSAIRRSITWAHIPVPRGRDDDAYFAPLRGLKLKPGTELYLGLVHFTDGTEGARRRLAAAKRVVTDFGVATECGLGRRSPGSIPSLLTLHREIAELG